MMPNIVEATILNGHATGENVFISRILIMPSDFTFQFKRLQFQVRLNFAMSINRALGQSLKVVGVDLLKPCFTHCQLYVSCSRVGKADNLYIIAPNGRTAIIVYPEAFQARKDNICSANS
ncbi:hypothetical protein AVEN_72215-1 [Araneus ventricosus]|uniref:ATP-dependent DNA helicase PIF1 n=1 Tax=Araneus ventricosus TaxID=182803 RepID=A0A4Y2HEU1_ARAVE|nr:hypothetical protein AVEN_72215-1 [Araneus ventricosus]